MLCSGHPTRVDLCRGALLQPFFITSFLISFSSLTQSAMTNCYCCRLSKCLASFIFFFFFLAGRLNNSRVGRTKIGSLENEENAAGKKKDCISFRSSWTHTDRMMDPTGLMSGHHVQLSAALPFFFSLAVDGTVAPYTAPAAAAAARALFLSPPVSWLAGSNGCRMAAE